MEIECTGTTMNSGVRKRKADNQDNERLSKRLSLLNLGLYNCYILPYTTTDPSAERDGRKLYVPVEQPSPSPSSSFTTTAPSLNSKPPVRIQDDDMMQVDNTAHKVYIYDLDAELSDSESSDDGKLVFLPDIQKHLRETRIPPSVRANSEGELAGCSQLVLYNVPTSLTVPKEQDLVRKAIIETRARAREKQQLKREAEIRKLMPQTSSTAMLLNGGVETRDWAYGIGNGNGAATTSNFGSAMAAEAVQPVYPSAAMADIPETIEDDPDAMDLG